MIEYSLNGIVYLYAAKLYKWKQDRRKPIFLYHNNTNYVSYDNIINQAFVKYPPMKQALDSRSHTIIVGREIAFIFNHSLISVYPNFEDFTIYVSKSNNLIENKEYTTNTINNIKDDLFMRCLYNDDPDTIRHIRAEYTIKTKLLKSYRYNANRVLKKIYELFIMQNYETLAYCNAETVMRRFSLYDEN